MPKQASRKKVLSNPADRINSIARVLLDHIEQSAQELNIVGLTDKVRGKYFPEGDSPREEVQYEREILRVEPCEIVDRAGLKVLVGLLCDVQQLLERNAQQDVNLTIMTGIPRPEE